MTEQGRSSLFQRFRQKRASQFVTGFGYGFGLLPDGSYRFWLPTRVVLARLAFKPRHYPFRVGPLSRLRELYWVLVRGHESEICERCGRPVPVVFFVPDAIWTLATSYERFPDGETAPGCLCPTCVDVLVEPRIDGYLKWTCAEVSRG